MEDLLEKLHPLIYSVVGQCRIAGMRRICTRMHVLVIEAVRDYEEERGTLPGPQSRVYFGITACFGRMYLHYPWINPMGTGMGRAF